MSFLSLAILSLFLFSGWPAAGRHTAGNPDAKPTPVLVELFTSEGCSSCPPADEFLSRLNRDQPLKGITVIGIEEHVDYWNHDGWVDPYSSPEWTSRQVTYVDHFKEGTAYTPQAVIDGQQSVVGVRERAIVNAIQQSAQQPQGQLDMTLEPLTPNGVLKFHVRSGKMPAAPNDSVEIWLAIAEKDVAQKVNNGENAGKELRHSAVLRSLQKLGTAGGNDETSFETSSQAKLSRDWNRQNLQVIVFAQEKKSKRVLGVALARPITG